MCETKLPKTGVVQRVFCSQVECAHGQCLKSSQVTLPTERLPYTASPTGPLHKEHCSKETQEQFPREKEFHFHRKPTTTTTVLFFPPSLHILSTVASTTAAASEVVRYTVTQRTAPWYYIGTHDRCYLTYSAGAKGPLYDVIDYVHNTHGDCLQRIITGPVG